MADDSDNLVLFDDDLDAILSILEEDEALEDQFTSSASNVQATEIICTDCNKKYKTKGGYERHRSAKHDNNKSTPCLTTSMFVDIVQSTVDKIKGNKTFAANIRKELSSFTYEQPGETSKEFETVKQLYNGYAKNENTEKFYRNYYSQIPLQSTNYFRGLSRNAATLLSTKVADNMLVHCKHVKSTPDNCVPATNIVLSTKEKAGLQYLGGYVIHNLHKKFARVHTDESEHAMTILKAGRQEKNYDSQKLVSSLSRGGLWAITPFAEKVFLRTEHFFRLSTTGEGKTKINMADITDKAISDSEVISNYQSMVSNSPLVAPNHTSKDVLYCMIKMYVRVRSFSIARDIVTHYKMKAKKSKDKALRKEIKRSCAVETQERQI